MSAAEALPTNDTGPFLRNLFAHVEEGWLTLFAVNRTTGAKAVKWRHVIDLDNLILDAHELEPDHCVWFGAATRKHRTPGRGGAADCAEIVGLWLDIDVAGPNHAATDLPPTIDAAEQLLTEFPIPPSVVIASGGGLQAWWPLKEPLAASDATTLLTRWGATWAERGKRHGWHIDNVFDLARVMRLPGTTNRKTIPRPVYVMRSDWTRRYGVDDIDQWLIDPPQIAAPTKRNVPYIGPERPGDAYNAAVSGHDLLLATGWTLDEQDTAGNYHYRAPHRANEQGVTGATYYPDDGHITIWSETFARQHGLTTKRPYDPFGYYTAVHHNGDFTAASTALEAAGYGTDQIADIRAMIAAPDKATAPDDPWPDPIPLGDAHDTPIFPIHVLPTWIRDHVEAVARELQTAPDLPAILALSALAITQAGHTVIAIRGSWREHLNLYVVIALPPGAGKSPAVRAMLRAIDRAERDSRKDIELRRKQVEMERRIVEGKLKKAEAAGDAHTAAGYLHELEASSLQIPVIPRLIADDATPEALAALLHEQHGRLALVSTEGGPFEMMIGRYSERANLEIYLQAWSGDTIRIDRVGRGSTVIHDPVLNVCLTVQPAVIAGLAERPELAGRGLTARFMYSVPHDFVGQRDLITDIDIPYDIVNRYEDGITRLLRHGRPDQPAVITLTDQARRMYLQWRQNLETQRAPHGPLRPLAEWTTKLESSVVRTAGLLAVADHTDEVDADTMARALEIGAYWLAHAQIVHDMWGADDTLRKARQVLTWLQQRQIERFTLRDLYGALRKSFPTAADTVPVLNLLAERGWVRPLFDGPITTGARGRPSPEFAVHPQNLWISDSHARHARHARKDISELLTHSLETDTSTRHRAHDAHDAHEHSTPPTILTDDMDDF